MEISRRHRAHIVWRSLLALVLGALVALHLSGTPVVAGPPAAFAPQQTFATDGLPRWVAVGDFNGDGKPDLVTANAGSNDVSVLLGNGDGTFGPQQTFTVGSTPVSVAVGDFNGDGKLDLVAANRGSTTVSVLLNMTAANGTTAVFTPQRTFATGASPFNVMVGDVNLDGTPDLVIANSGSTTVSVLLNTTAANASAASFAPQQTFTVGTHPFDVAVGDFNGDNAPDLAVANRDDNTVSVLLNTLPFTITATGGTPQSTASGTPFPAPLAVHVADGLGHPLPGVTVTFTAPASGPSGTFAGGVTTVQATTNALGNLAAPPVVTANTILGTYSVSASVVGASAPATFALTNTPGPATHFTVAAPASATAGIPVSVTVTALDQYGNTATGYTGTIHFTSTDTLATLPADYPFGASDAGVHTFTATFGAAGTWNLTATDTLTTTITGTQTGIVITPVATTTTLTITTNVAGTPPTASRGSPVVFSVTVVPTGPTTLPMPTGSVTFSDGSTPLAVVPLASGFASFETSTLAIGVYHITTTYTPASPSPYATSQATGDVTIIVPPLIGIGVTPSPATLKVGGTRQYTAMGAYQDGSTVDITGQVTWSSDNTAVAQPGGVKAGEVVAVAPGTAHITATLGGVTGFANVAVSEGQAAGVAPVPAPASRPGSAGTAGEPSATPAPAPSGTGRGGTTSGTAPAAAPPGR
jgi:hypothetical protein